MATSLVETANRVAVLRSPTFLKPLSPCARVENASTGLPVHMLDVAIAHLERVLERHGVNRLPGRVDLAQGDTYPDVFERVRQLPE